MNLGLYKTLIEFSVTLENIFKWQIEIVDQPSIHHKI